MRTLVVIVIGTILASSMSLVSIADDRKDRRLDATLRGIEEPPAVSSTGRGAFNANINEERTEIAYTLTYEDLEGTIQQAHIHLGQRGVNGGIAVFLCSNLGNGPAGTQACPTTLPATITGTITAANVIGPTGQGMAAGEFSELLRAIDREVTYVNVHTDKHPSGEIRGQIADAD